LTTELANLVWEGDAGKKKLGALKMKVGGFNKAK